MFNFLRVGKDLTDLTSVKFVEEAPDEDKYTSLPLRFSSEGEREKFLEIASTPEGKELLEHVARDGIRLMIRSERRTLSTRARA